MSSIHAKLNLLIVNQHGENRGDESAFKAMLRSFRARRVCDATVIGQFRAPAFRFPSRDLEDIRYLNMVMSPFEGILLVWCTLLKFAGLPPLAPKNSRARRIMDAYQQADLVVSGPGGPYFGDIYRGHEPVHWFFVFIATVHRKPCYIYAPSAGPFSGSLLNFVRRRVYRQLRVVICRESQSAEYIRRLDSSIEPIVTADSALQEHAPNRLDSPPPTILAKRDAGRPIVAISILRYHALDEEQSEYYENAVREAIIQLESQGDYQFVFLPQLYGGYHSDVDYMSEFIGHLPDSIDATLLDDALDSDAQRWVISQSVLVIASRYHPQIFAASARTPFVALCYQHKSSAFMSDIDMADFAIEINNIKTERLLKLVAKCVSDSESIRVRLDRGVRKKEVLARLTTQLILENFEQYLCT